MSQAVKEPVFAEPTRMPISIADLDHAKRVTKDFDVQKVYDKIQCETNYLGVLGEFKFHTWLDSQGVYHVWNQFVKKAWHEPDFIIANYSIDVKTTFDTKMWFQTPVHDIYVFSRVNQDLQEIFFIGYITGKELADAIEDKVAQPVERNGRIDYVLSIDKLRPFNQLLQSLILAPKRAVVTETKMENQTEQTGNSQEALPTWDNIEATRPKIKWADNQTHEVTFKCDKPKEIMWKDVKKGDQRLFIFEVINEGEEKVIMSGAKSMVQGIKSLGPLKDKTALIKKTIKNGKQFYEVHEADVAE